VSQQQLQTAYRFILIKSFLITAQLFVKKNGQSEKAKTNKTFTGIVFAFVFFSMVASLTGCSDRPTDAELDRLRQEAIARNAAMIMLQDKEPSKRDWLFTVQGQTSTGKPVQLSLSQLDALATTSIWTREPHNTSDPKAIFHFRGVAVSTLIDEFGVAANVTDVTFVARDGFRATVSLADLRQYPIVIALERNNKKIPRSDGGPLYLVFPYTDFPQLQQKYPDRFWAFYLTDMVIGTEPIRLKVGSTPQRKSPSDRQATKEQSADRQATKEQKTVRLFKATDLNKLQQVTIEGTVGYRIGWPADKVKLSGVRVRDAVAAAGLTLPPNSSVIVRGKSPVHRNTASPIRLKVSDVNRCDILLATHWGDDRMPIPAKMGGPVTLALSSDCQTQSDNQRWVTFVEELEVTE
jgi:hypothetical protein